MSDFISARYVLKILEIRAIPSRKSFLPSSKFRKILKMYKFIRYLTERLCYIHLVKQIHDSTFSGVGLPLTECSLLWLPYLTKCQPLTVYIDYILDVPWHRH